MMNSKQHLLLPLTVGLLTEEQTKNYGKVWYIFIPAEVSELLVRGKLVNKTNICNIPFEKRDDYRSIKEIQKIASDLRFEPKRRTEGKFVKKLRMMSAVPMVDNSNNKKFDVFCRGVAPRNYNFEYHSILLAE